jgi:hypothetical protein
MKSRSMALADQEQGHWVTLNGAHVFIKSDAGGGVKENHTPHNLAKKHPQGDAFGGAGREIGVRPGSLAGKPLGGPRTAAQEAANKRVLDALPKSMSISQLFKAEETSRATKKIKAAATGQETTYPQMF